MDSQRTRMCNGRHSSMDLVGDTAVVGNLTQDGRWSYTYDAENRLIEMETLSTVPAAARLKLKFTYDYLGRRVRKEVYAWNNAARAYGPMPQTVRKFIYDDWNLVAELDVRDKLVRSYVWGPDLSGTLQGAGGIGGLLFINDGDSTYCPCYDGYGNITGLINADNGTVAAKYEYSPYGQVLISSGEYADSNPFQFSTKYTDTEVGLVYFGYRYYNPDMGRWMTRDPIGDGGEITEEWLNVYGFVRNQPISFIDPDGRMAMAIPVVIPVVIEGGEAVALTAAAAAVVAYKACKDVRCNFKWEPPHHSWKIPRFGIPPWKTCYMKHIRVTCWRKGKSGSKFLDLQFPYGPCYKFMNGIPPVTH